MIFRADDFLSNPPLKYPEIDAKLCRAINESILDKTALPEYKSRELAQTISVTLGVLSVAERAGHLHPEGPIRVGNELYGVTYQSVKASDLEN